MFINSFFTKNGIPETGLAPTLSIWLISSNALIKDEEGMGELAGGFYKYVFNDGDENAEYAVRCNGGESLPPGERYSYTTFMFTSAVGGQPIIGFN